MFPVASPQTPGLLSAALERHLPVDVCPAQGGYFLVADTRGVPDMRFVRELAAGCGVVCTPMSVFYAEAHPESAPCTLVRFTVCKSRAHIERACEALARM